MVKRLLLIFLLVFTFIFNCTKISANTSDSIPRRKKIAVVLSGGGAKGMAHIGVLKVLKEVGIPVDYYIGTSMGSIIGGLSAIGYNPEQLDSMVKKQDWQMLLSDKMPREDQNLEERESTEKYIISTTLGKNMKKSFSGGLIKAQNISNLFSELTVGYHDPSDFNEFPIPFACVAFDIVTGKEIVFHNGSLPQAMRASMAIPGVFTPIRIDHKVLVDGGVIDNYPTDIAKEMGADIIIGIDVQSKLLESNELNNTGSVLGQLVNLMGQDRYKKNINLTDIYIKVNVDGYSSASFSPSAIDTLIQRGEDAANLNIEKLYKLKDSLNLSTNNNEQTEIEYPYEPCKEIYVRNIIFNGIGEDNNKWLMGRCNLKNNSMISIETINKAINILCANIGYAGATYSLPKAYDKGYDLIFNLTRQHKNKINLGVRFDTEDIASVLINITSECKTKTPSQISATGRLGKNYFAGVDYSLEPAPLKKIKLSGLYQYNNLYYYYKGKKTHNSNLRYYKTELSYSNVWIKNIKIDFGVKYEHYNYGNVFYIENAPKLDIKPDNFITYFTKIYLDSFDKAYFPTSGVSAKASYSLYTDNFTTYDHKTPFSALQGSFETVIGLSNRFKLLPSIAGRILIGKQVSYSKMNVMGGDIMAKYLPQELPFIGIKGNDIVGNSLIICGAKFRQRMGRKHYLSLITNYALSSNKIENIFKEYKNFGYGIQYGLDTMFGPVEASINFSNKGDDMDLYINLGYKF